MKKIALLLILFFSVAKSDGDKIRVGVNLFSPMAIEKDNSLIGYDMDLWKEIAKDHELEYEFIPIFPLSVLLNKLEEGSIDAAIGGITITSERERRYDMSHAYFHSGLGVLINKDNSFAKNDFLSDFFNYQFWSILFVFITVVLIIAHLVWISEKGENAINDSYYPGILEAVYFVVVTMSTVGYGDFTPKKWLGRFMSILLIIIGISYFSFVLSQATSLLTTNRLEVNIESLEDLWGKNIGTKEGTSCEIYLKGYDLSLSSYPRIKEAYQALSEKKIDAVVYDMPSLVYFLRKEDNEEYYLASNIIAREDYAFFVKEGDKELLEKINRSILKLKENGFINKIKKIWFGEYLQ